MKTRDYIRKTPAAEPKIDRTRLDGDIVNWTIETKINKSLQKNMTVKEAEYMSSQEDVLIKQTALKGHNNAQ